MQKILQRIPTALQVVPSGKDWLEAAGLLGIFALIYVPIGLQLGFLTISQLPSLPITLGVMAGAFVMPAIVEEMGFRALLIPHPTESTPWQQLWTWIGVSLVAFIAYHLPPWTPAFFKTPVFIMGAALIGIICTISYRRSGSIWLPILLHWVIVAGWLLGLGGLEKFQQLLG